MLWKNAHSRYLFLVVLVISFATQFVALGYPNEVVFDEVHFGKFITAYCCTGERFFDIHPPHGKLLIAAAARLGGYAGGPSFEGIGEQYVDTIPTWALRFAPALAGSLVPVIVFVLLRQLGTSSAIALLGGLAFALDNAFTVQSRIIALDGMLLVGIFGSLSLFLAGARLRQTLLNPPLSRGRKQTPSRSPLIRGEVLAYIASGAVAGFAAGVKFTGLAALALISFILFVQFISELWSPRRLRITIYGLRITTIIAAALIVYLAGWKVHYAILDQPGPGDVWQVPSGNFLADTAWMHGKMLNANYGLSSTHPYSSMWWSWPLMARPIFYWQSPPYPSDTLGDAPSPPPGQQSRGLLYFIGNPVVWWGGSLLFLVAVVNTLFRFVRGESVSGQESRIKNQESREKDYELRITNYGLRAHWLPLAGFFISYIPLIRIPRPLFMYHYMMPLLFSVLFGLVWLDTRYRKQLKDVSHLPVWYYITVGVLVIGFILFSPLTYGFPADRWQALLFWFDTWR